MKITATFLPPPDTVITEEAESLLIDAISSVHSGILNSWKNLPLSIRGLVQEVTITPDLHEPESEPDMVKVSIIIKKEAFGEPPRFSMHETLLTAHIKCLEPDIKNFAEKRFTTIVLGLTQQISLNLQEFLQSILSFEK
jgi:hypothetical protein